MAEKGDLGLSTEAVSLPPNYAHSEAFTDSPPPAYQHKNSNVKIARMVCLTALALTFLIGFFVVAHKWVITSHKAEMQKQYAFESIETVLPEELNGKTSPLVQGASLVSLDIDNNKIEDDIVVKESETEVILINEVPPTVETSTEGKEEEEALDMQNLPELSPPEPFQNPFDSMNKMNIFGDIFNAPQLKMENNPNCRMKKRNRNLGPGIMTSTISIVCDGDEENDADEPPMLPSPMLPPGARRIEPPMDLLNTILKVLGTGTDFTGLKSIPRDGDNPMNLPKPVRGNTMRIPLPIAGSESGPEGFPFKLNMIPMGRIELRARPQEHQHQHQQQQLPPMFQRMPFPGQGPFPFPMGNENFSPLRQHSLPPNVKIIRMARPMNQNEDMPNGPLPFQMHPIMKMMPNRQARVIRIKPQGGNSPFPFGFPNDIIFPQQSGEVPHPMPEASGRGLPDPVTLPGMKLLRLPFTPPFEPFSMEPKMTHMELRQFPEDRQPYNVNLSPFQRINIPPFDESPFFNDERHHADSHFPFTPDHNHIEQPEYYNNEEDMFNDYFDEDAEEFGPPRTHTLMQNAGRPVFIREQRVQEETNNFQNEDPNFHTHADGVSHTHPHEGPHTHIGGEIFPLDIPYFQQPELRPDFHVHDNGVAHSHSHDDNFHSHDGVNFHTHDDGTSHTHPNEGPHTNNDDSNFHTHENGVAHSHPYDGPHIHNDDFFINEPSFEIPQNIESEQDQIFENEPPMMEDLPENFDQSVFEPQPEDDSFIDDSFIFDRFGPHVQTEQDLSDAQADYLPLEPDYETQPERFVPHLPEEEQLEEQELFEPQEPFQPQDIADVIDARGNAPESELRTYAPEGRYAENAPPMEENAELLQTDNDDQFILIK